MSERLARVHALCKQLAPSKRSHGALREFDLRALLAALSDNDVRFVVIGGVAVPAHGYVRGNRGLDILCCPTEKKSEGARNYQATFGRKVIGRPPAGPALRSGAASLTRRASGTKSPICLAVHEKSSAPSPGPHRSRCAPTPT